MGQLGADVEQLDRLARTIGQAATSLRGAVTATTAAASSSWWHGDDAVRFRDYWTRVAAPTSRRVADALDGLDRAVRVQAEQQRAASAAVGGGRPAGFGTGGNKENPAPVEGAKYGKLDPTKYKLWGSKTGPNGKPIEGAPDMTDVDQGALNDCYVMAALAAAALADAQRVKDNIRDNGDGTYTVKLYINVMGVWLPVDVTVTDEIPLDDNGNPVYAQPSSDAEMWAMLYEKAYAKLKGGYPNLNKGGPSEEVLETLYGRDFTTTQVSDMSDEELIRALANKPSVTGTPKLPDGADAKKVQKYKDQGVFNWHVYVVKDVVIQDGQPTKILLYNPHGPSGQQPKELTIEEYRELFEYVVQPN